MRLLDEQYTEDPTYGVLRMTAHLRRQGYPVNEKRVRRLLRIMGLEAVYQKPDTRRSNPEHSVYPYLLLPSYPNTEQVTPVTRPGKMRIRDEFRVSNFGSGRE
jgi:transposase InsO family protein